MPVLDKPRVQEPKPSSSPLVQWWIALLIAGGLGFGLIGERRPFGTDVLAHPLVVFFVIVGFALLVVRVAAQKPVPKVIPDRKLGIGCLLGLGAYLVGNWIAAHILIFF